MWQIDEYLESQPVTGWDLLFRGLDQPVPDGHGKAGT
jgi:hypothetical protein